MLSAMGRSAGVREKRDMTTATTAQLYRGYDNEDELSMNGCIFRAGQHLGLVAAGETGFGWNKAEICDLSDKIRARVADDPTVLNDLAKEIRVRLADGLNLFPRLDQAPRAAKR
jgi:hypothetical protein